MAANGSCALRVLQQLRSAAASRAAATGAAAAPKAPAARFVSSCAKGPLILHRFAALPKAQASDSKGKNKSGRWVPAAQAHGLLEGPRKPFGVTAVRAFRLRTEGARGCRGLQDQFEGRRTRRFGLWLFGMRRPVRKYRFGARPAANSRITAISSRAPRAASEATSAARYGDTARMMSRIFDGVLALHRAPRRDELRVQLTPQK